MTRLIRKATMMSVGGLLLAGVALASVPDNTSVLPTNPITGYHAIYMGSKNLTGGGSPGLHPASPTIYDFDVTVKAAGVAVPFSVVRINFAACRKLYIAPNTAGAAVTTETVTCPNLVTCVAGGDGVAHFRVRGESENPSGAGNPEGNEFAPVHALPANPIDGCAVVSADNGGGGVFAVIGNLFVGTPNEDHSSSGGAVSGADLSSVIGDVAFVFNPAATCQAAPAHCYLNRTDLDQNGVVDGVDISQELNIIIAVAAYNGNGCDALGSNDCCLPRIN